MTAKNPTTMEKKIILNQVDVVIQSLLIIGFITTAVIASANSRQEDFFFVFLFSLAFYQVASSLVLGIRYNDGRRKKYLWTLLVVQGGGSLLAYLSMTLTKSSEVGMFIFIGVWIFAPIIMIIWCYVNGWLAVRDAKNEIDKSIEKVEDNSGNEFL